LDQYDRRLDQHSLALELRFDVEAAKRERDSARDEESKRVANEKLRIAEERLQLATRAEDRRGTRGAEVSAATRGEINRAEENLTAEGRSAPTNPNLGGSASETYLDMAARNPRLRGGDVVRLTNDLFKDPRGFQIAPDFSFAVQKATGSRLMLPDSLSESLRQWTESSRRGSTSTEPRPPQEGGRGQTSMTRPGGNVGPALAGTQPASNDRILSEAARYNIPANEYLSVNDPVNAWIYRNTRTGVPISDREMQRAASRFNMPVGDLRARIQRLQAATP